MSEGSRDIGGRGAPAQGATTGMAGLAVDRERLRVTVHGDRVPLSGLQMKLLLHLLDHPERVFSRPQLIDAVWPDGRDVDPRNVSVAVCRLKRALGGAASLIECVKFFGYRFNPVGGPAARRGSQHHQSRSQRRGGHDER